MHFCLGSLTWLRLGLFLPMSKRERLLHRHEMVNVHVFTRAGPSAFESLGVLEPNVLGLQGLELRLQLLKREQKYGIRVFEGV